MSVPNLRGLPFAFLTKPNLCSCTLKSDLHEISYFIDRIITSIFDFQSEKSGAAAGQNKVLAFVDNVPGRIARRFSILGRIASRNWENGHFCGVKGARKIF